MGRRKNRKKQSAGFIFPAPLAGVLVSMATVSLTYLWLCGRCEALGAQIKVLEERKTEVQKRVINEEFKWAGMKSPSQIERLLRQFNIEMTWPEKGRVIQVREPGGHAYPIQVAATTRSRHRDKGNMVND